MSDESGFSLVALTVAIMLLGVGMIGLASTGLAAYSMQTESGARTTAVQIARAYMEDLKGRGVEALAAEEAVRVNEDGEADDNGLFTRSVELQSAGENLKKVMVRVSFPRSRRPIELSTIVYERAFR